MGGIGGNISAAARIMSHGRNWAKYTFPDSCSRCASLTGSDRDRSNRALACQRKVTEWALRHAEQRCKQMWISHR